MAHTNKPRLTFNHTTDYFGFVTAHFNVPGYKYSMCALITGRPRIKLRFHILQNASKESPINIYASIRHNDWQAVQDRFDYLGKEYRTAGGTVKTPAIVVGHKRIA